MRGYVSARPRRLGTAFVFAAVLFQVLWLGLPAFLLSVLLVASYVLWIASPWRIVSRLRPIFFLALAVFLTHATEEFLTGFQQALPELFGRAPWSDGRFLVFNAAWALVFLASALATRPGRPLPVLVALFFALAGGVGNGIFHLLLVVQRGAYFPGAWTAPLCFCVGVWMLRLLYRQSPAVEIRVTPEGPRSPRPT